MISNPTREDTEMNRTFNRHDKTLSECLIFFTHVHVGVFQAVASRG